MGIIIQKRMNVVVSLSSLRCKRLREHESFWYSMEQKILIPPSILFAFSCSRIFLFQKLRNFPSRLNTLYQTALSTATTAQPITRTTNSNTLGFAITLYAKAIAADTFNVIAHCAPCHRSCASVLRSDAKGNEHWTGSHRYGLMKSTCGL